MKFVGLLILGGGFVLLFVISQILPGDKKERAERMGEAVGGPDNAMIILGFGLVAVVLVGLTLIGC